MRDDEDLLKLGTDKQLSFPFVEHDKYPVEFVGTTPEGVGLFRRKEDGGRWSYWTDEEPGGVCILRGSLGNPISLFAALEHLGEGQAMWRHVGNAFEYEQFDRDYSVCPED